jgi:5'-deoxynucleotidase YfbR-like HD superfamily hydrolase
MIKNYNKFNNLINIMRWSGKRVLIPESDSDHVWGMNALAIDFVSKLPDKYNKKDFLKDLIYRIALHDLGEAFYTDIPRPFKYKTKELAKLIQDTEDLMIDENMAPEIAEDVKSAKSKVPTDFIGFIVSIFDAVQAGLKMREELTLGNQFFVDEINNSIWILEDYKAIINQYKDEMFDDNDQLLINYIDEAIKTIKNV